MSVKLLKEFDDMYLTETFEQEGKLYICFMKGEDTKSFWYTKFDGETFSEIEEKKVIDEDKHSRFVPIVYNKTGTKYIIMNSSIGLVLFI
jgi:hypothetical protein